MTDKATRLAQRSGPALVERLRADELPAYTTALDRPGPGYEELRLAARSGDHDDRVIALAMALHGRPQRVPCDPLDAVRLLAFCGVEEARELAPVEPSSGGLRGFGLSGLWWDDKATLGQRLSEVQRLAAKLPPKRVEVGCLRCEDLGALIDRPCSLCKGTGKVTRDTPAETWLLVVAALAVAEECCREDDRGCDGCRYADTELEDHDSGCPWRALDACQAYVTEPTPERERTWARLGLDCAPWVPVPYRYNEDPLATVALGSPVYALHAAAEVLDPARVRELTSAAVVRAVLGCAP